MIISSWRTHQGGLKYWNDQRVVGKGVEVVTGTYIGGGLADTDSRESQLLFVNFETYAFPLYGNFSMTALPSSLFPESVVINDLSKIGV